MAKLITPEILENPEFTKLANLGFSSDYVTIKDGTMSPGITADEATALGFYPKGTKVRWVDRNGFPYQRETARKTFDPSETYIVQACQIGRSSSTYQFEGISGRWNSVMFEAIDVAG
jgi:hypothetical protein